MTTAVAYGTVVVITVVKSFMAPMKKILPELKERERVKKTEGFSIELCKHTEEKKE